LLTLGDQVTDEQSLSLFAALHESGFGTKPTIFAIEGKETRSHCTRAAPERLTAATLVIQYHSLQRGPLQNVDVAAVLIGDG
jgi:hypothetical protein